MRFILVWVTCIFAALTSGCATVDAAKADLGHGKSQSYSKPYDAVWDAALVTLSDMDISVVSADKSSSTITGTVGVSAFSWGERVALRLTSEGDQNTRVEVISKRAIAINVTASDWTQDILQKIGKKLLRGNASLPAGKAIQALAEFKKLPFPRAFAISDDGLHWGTSSSVLASTKERQGGYAIDRCTQGGGKNCRLYAFNADIID